MEIRLVCLVDMDFPWNQSNLGHGMSGATNLLMEEDGPMNFMSLIFVKVE